MRTKHRASAAIFLDLECILGSGDDLPDALAALQAMLAGQPLIAHASIHNLSPWTECAGHWPTLVESPCEQGDLVIHACCRDGTGRTLLAECVLDGQVLRLAYLPNAKDEAVERAVYDYLRTTHPGYKDSFYPCPAYLAGRFHGTNRQGEDEGAGA
jgi:hypothetical protein